jgi:hypothetical protein
VNKHHLSGTDGGHDSVRGGREIGKERWIVQTAQIGPHEGADLRRTGQSTPDKKLTQRDRQPSLVMQPIDLVGPNRRRFEPRNRL